MSDPFKPPPGAQEWLAACLLAYIAYGARPYEHEGSDRAYGLIGAIEHHAALSPEQRGKVNHYLWPDRYDEHGQVRKEPRDG